MTDNILNEDSLIRAIKNSFIEIERGIVCELALIPELPEEVRLNHRGYLMLISQIERLKELSVWLQIMKNNIEVFSTQPFSSKSIRDFLLDEVADKMNLREIKHKEKTIPLKTLMKNISNLSSAMGFLYSFYQRIDERNIKPFPLNDMVSESIHTSNVLGLLSSVDVLGKPNSKAHIKGGDKVKENYKPSHDCIFEAWETGKHETYLICARAITDQVGLSTTVIEKHLRKKYGLQARKTKSNT